MNSVFRLMTAVLLVCLLAPQLALADGDRGKPPYEIGERLFARKDFKAALKYYQRALDKNDARAHYRMGLILEGAGKDRDALKHYQLFIELGQPGVQQSDAAVRVGAIEERLKKAPPRPPAKKQLKKKAAARPVEKKAPKQVTSRPADLLEQGKSLLSKGDYLEAERVLLQAVAQDPSRPEPHFYLGEVYMKLEEYRKAEAAYKKAKGSY